MAKEGDVNESEKSSKNDKDGCLDEEEDFEDWGEIESDSEEQNEENSTVKEPGFDQMDEIDQLLNEDDEDKQKGDSKAVKQKEKDTLLESIMDSYVSDDSTDRSNQNQEKVNNCPTIINPFKSLVSQVEQARIWVQKSNGVDDGKGQSFSNDKSVSACEERTLSCTYPKCKKM